MKPNHRGIRSSQNMLTLVEKWMFIKSTARKRKQIEKQVNEKFNIMQEQ